MADREMKNGHWSVVIGHSTISNVALVIEQ
jgi:hypothetical protein